MNKQPESHDTVAGERTIPTVSKNPSLHSQLTTWSGLALIAIVGACFLFYYYRSVFNHQHLQEVAQKKAQEQQSQGDGSLPKLGAIPFPSLASPVPVTTEPVEIGDVFGPPPAIPDPAMMNTMTAPPSGPPEKTPEQLAEERRLNSPVFISTSVAATATPSNEPIDAVAAGNNPVTGTTVLGDALKPTQTVAVRAQKLPTLTYLIPKGAKGDCTLETAISSQLPGLVTCVLAFVLFGANGKVVMLERGTTLTGETRTQVQQGQNRVFVLWTEARTPTGVTAQLDSPATDALGRSGIIGEVDTHFWERFGAAILISVVNGATQAASNYASGAGTSSGTSFNYNAQGASQVMTEVLRNTINIPPTINIAQGERVQILFARDVDFRPVYALNERYPPIQ